MTDLDKLREAGLLKREEINKLSEQNMKYLSEIEAMHIEKSKMDSIIEQMENEKEERDKQIKQAMHENEDQISEQTSLEIELEAMTKKCELKDGKIAEYEMEIANLEDDRNQLRLTLNHLNVHVGKVQDDKNAMDQDFGSLNEEMIKYKKEARQWKNSYNSTLSELETLQIEYEELTKQHKLEQCEHEKKKVLILQNEQKEKELNDQIKQMKDLKVKYTDIRYEIAGKDEHLKRIKAENEQLRSDLKAENNESTKNAHKVRVLSKKLDKATTKNAKLSQQIDEFEDRVTDSVARPLYNELIKEVKDYKVKMQNISKERDEAKLEISKFSRLCNDLQSDVDKLSNDNKHIKDERDQFSTNNTFWKNKVKSLREEIKRLHSQPIAPLISPVAVAVNGNNNHSNNNVNVTPSPSSSDHEMIEIEKTKMYKKLKQIEKEKDEALAVMNQLKKALNSELQKANNMTMQNKILNSHTTEEVKTLLRKNNALKVLANELSDTVADKEQNIKHLKEVRRLLGAKCAELEQTNKRLRESINEIDVLENVHALSTMETIKNGIGKE